MSLARPLARPLAIPLARPLVQVTGPRLDPIATIAVMGDSLSSGVDWGDTSSRERSYIFPALSGTQRALELVLNSEGRNFQTGGFGAEEIRDTWLPQVIAASPDACVFMAGANDIAAAAGATRPNLQAGAESIFVVLAEIITELKNAGIVPIICTLTPDNFPTSATWPAGSGQYHADWRTVRALTNDLIRSQAPGLGAIVCDWAGRISTDPLDDTALADPGYLFDNVHFYLSGDQQLGVVLLDTIKANTKLIGDPFAVPPVDDPLWKTGNPYMTGDSSGLATGWNVSTSGTITTIRTKNADGSQRINCTEGPDPGAASTNYRLTRFVQVTDDQFDGKQFRAVIKVRPQESGFEFWNMVVRCDTNNLDVAGTSRDGSSPKSPTSAEVAEMGKYWDHQPEMFFLTPPVTCIGGTGTNRRRLTVTFTVRGRGTLDIDYCGIFEVPTP
jgi:lysophospholipase L1-like esterase